MAKAAPGNDNIQALPAPARASFSVEDQVSTRRRVKLKTHAIAEGAIGRILKIRSPGRLYDVLFSAAEDVVMTLSHCDIARYHGLN